MPFSDEEEEPVSGNEEEEEEELVSSEEEEPVSGDEEEESVSTEDKKEESVCRLSHPAHPHTLSRRAGENPPGYKCFAGSGRRYTASGYKFYYYHCTKCDVNFHEYCHKWPSKMTHPYHPQHPLIFTVLNSETGVIHDSNIHDYNDEGSSSDSGIPDHDEGSIAIHDHSNIFDNCSWCGVNVKLYAFFYRCSICNFCLDPTCSKKFPLPTITNPKSHHHSLIFLPRPLLHPCDACGLVEKSDPSYVCFQCNYVVHESCLDLPRVIKLTRHPHRLFYTPFLSPKISLCRLCYKTVDNKCGQYYCNHDDCSYIVHSKCATHNKIWDGRELKWEPEEFGETEDVVPFKKVGDNLIKYFCHEHHLKLERYDGVRDVDKQCAACILNIDSRDFYNCMQCDFFLHEVCANLPRKLDHALHRHPLFLDPISTQYYHSMDCYVCSRTFGGFRYKCPKNECESIDIEFQIDVRCILVPDCFTHQSHEHPLFIPIYTAKESTICKGCKRDHPFRYLKCTQCEFALCYECATIPDKLHYKDVALPLSLCYGEVSDETYWCEVCEKKLDPSEWFYTCNEPYITIHRRCVFGNSAYMKPGYTFFRDSYSVNVLGNSSNTRPICNQCNYRCSSSIYFKLPDEIAICSFGCLLLY